MPSLHATKPSPTATPPLQSPLSTQSGASTPAAVAHNISPSSTQSPATCSSLPSVAHTVSPDESSTGASKRPPTSPPRCRLPNAEKPEDKALVSKLLPDTKRWWNPAEGATGKLMCDMDKPTATRANSKCTEDLLQTLLPEIDWESACKGFLGWKNDALPTSNNFVAHEAPKALKTLLTLIKGEPVTAEEEERLLQHGIPAHTCFHYVQCIVTKNVNLHLVPALMPDAEFHGLIVTIFRLAHTPLPTFSKFNSIRGEAPATPATMFWRACIDNVGSLHLPSKKAPKDKQQTSITAFIPGHEGTPAPAPAPAPTPAKSPRSKGVKFSGKQFVSPSEAAAARPSAASATPSAAAASTISTDAPAARPAADASVARPAAASAARAAAPPDPATGKTVAPASKAPHTGKSAKPQSILKQGTASASSTSASSATRLELYAVVKTRDHIFRIRLRLPIETKSGSPNDTALTAFQQWYSAFAGEVQGLFLLPWKDSDMATVSPITCVADFPSQLTEF